MTRRLVVPALTLLAASALLTSGQDDDVPRETVAPVPPVVLPPEPEPEAPVELTDDPPAEPLTVREEVLAVLTELGRADEFDCVDVIFAGESSWRPDAIGDDGDSFGLGQRNAPAHGAPPWPWPVREQVLWFVDYADDRYGGLCPAADRWRQRADERGGAGWW